MRISLRTMVLWTFGLLVLSSCLQGVLAITTTAHSAQQVTYLENEGLAPAVGLDILSQNVDQERALLAADLVHMSANRVRAVNDELTSLDASIRAEAARVLTRTSLQRWSRQWTAYISLRATYMAAIRQQPARPLPHLLLPQLSDRLDVVLDVLQSEAGTRLYGAENLYVRAIESDWRAIRGTISGFIVALVVGAVLALVIIRRLTGGLGNLAATATAITHGTLGVRADQSGGDEIAMLASAFNHMTDALLSAERRADSDPLTGLLNHRAFHVRLSQEIAQARQSGQNLCVLMIDINNFKLFNDTYGHPVGDQVLTTFADLLRQQCRASDYLARYGGDEFMVLAPNTDLDEGRHLAERLLAAATATAIRVREATSPLPLALSIGVASAPDEAEATLPLMELADRRMFESKGNGGGLSGPRASLSAALISTDAPFSVLDGLVTAIDHKDHYTREHSEWVARFADMMAEALEFSPEARQRLRIAALIHDVGKIGIPDHILRKPGRLSDDEYTTMKHHVALSEMVVAQVLPSRDVVDAVRCHHERWDGQGYPHGLSGTQVPLEGRIMIIADASSAMYLDRPYRKGLIMDELIAELLRHSGKQFDPTLTDLFVATLRSSDRSSDTSHCSVEQVWDKQALARPA